ncbi:MAG TPA: secretin and TonB N-terminal domain-containing protein [Bacteroidia bacterium]|jgi:type IV pilus assembly protein PilQ|nr:secretin and TonB N-terminal domain-containing protein [Bacteroidia bacterium]
MRTQTRYIILFFSIFFALNIFSQDRIEVLDQKLKDLSKTVPQLKEKVEFSLNGSSIQELLTGIATLHNLNVTVDPSVTGKIYNNFTNVPVSEVFIFLCKQYNLDIVFTGSIMYFTPIPTAPVEPKKVVVKQLQIRYDTAKSQISFDLQNDSLIMVCKEITRKTGKNIILSPELTSKTVNSFIQDLPLETALENLAFANTLTIFSTDGGKTYMIEKADKPIDKSTSPKQGNGTNPQTGQASGLTVKSDVTDRVSLSVLNTPIADVLASVTSKMNKSYFLFSELKGNISLNVENVTYDQFLTRLFNGTDFTYKKDSSIYLIGQRKIEGLRATKIYQFKYRTTDKIMDIIPAELKKDVEMYIYHEQNSLIMSGSQPRINEIYALLLQLDKVVPVISIDVIIFDVRDTRSVSTGIDAGIGTPPPSANTLLSGLDMSLSANVINNIISGINGFGALNLGNVGPNFYINIKALETRGYLKVRSTPKIATLNGTDAKLSIGSTEYYLETTTTLVGSVTGGAQTQINYKPINADLSVSITPVLSADEYVTLDIKVKQSTFTDRISSTAPPGTINRDFTSKIRVKNSETIILGGLEEYDNTESTTGIPILSRIPILKWLFSSVTKGKTKNRLVIVVKPTVIY